MGDLLEAVRILRDRGHLRLVLMLITLARAGLLLWREERELIDQLSTPPLSPTPATMKLLGAKAPNLNLSSSLDTARTRTRDAGGHSDEPSLVAPQVRERFISCLRSGR